jgi:MFS family permease
MVLHRPLFPEGKAACALPTAAPCVERARPYVLAATILASAMAFIDGSVVPIALPAIQRDLHASFATLQWVVNAYSLTLDTLPLVGGSAGDRYGRRLIFLAGTALFTLASIGCALAPDATVLIIARLIQGIGAALVSPQSLAISATNPLWRAAEPFSPLRTLIERAFVNAYSGAMLVAGMFGALAALTAFYTVEPKPAFEEQPGSRPK